MSDKISPFAPSTLPHLPPINGVTMAGVEANIKYRGRTDLLLMSFCDGTALAGVFTRSSTAGAPVRWDRECLKGGRIRGLVVNSGNSNVFTGKAGEDLVRKTAEEAAILLGVRAEEVLVSSTGVIGELPPTERILAGVRTAHPELKADGWEAAARAIMTTDTFPKMVTRTVRLGDVDVTLNGIVKGSGMIAPNMATMLGYIATDANIEPGVLQTMLSESVETTFNAITVDSDTSTSDTILAAATCRASHPAIESKNDSGANDFAEALHAVCEELAHLVIKDGEGVSKFATITVQGAAKVTDAKTVAMSIANSPLVKTAIAGSDPNWGRIMMAVGKSPVSLDQNKLKLWIGDILIAENGTIVPGYNEAPVAVHMAKNEVAIRVDLGQGGEHFTVWTSDLTHGYIDINVDYRS